MNKIKTNQIEKLISEKESIDERVQRNYLQIYFDYRENGRVHNPYDQEVREISSIRNGDVEALKRSWDEDYTGTIGTLAKDQLRHFKNLAIVLITLGSRAAIEGGVQAELAFSLSDSYILRVEDAQSPEEAYKLGKEAELHYTNLVADMQNRNDNKKNLLISKCKDYIFQHLLEKIKVQEIADELHVNVSYLSDLFSRNEGYSISSYISNEKIKLAKNLLKYSTYAYSDIASYLGFCSHSHMGSQFKRSVGLTPAQFREKYGVKYQTNEK